MNTKKITELKERTDKAYALLASLAADQTQSTLVQIVSRDARNHVSAVMCSLDAALDRRTK